MQVQLDIDLIRQYARPVPRYTSYPTAPHFSTAIGPDAFLDALRSPREGTHRPLSLYVHLPFCRQLCYYCGCHMKITHDPERITRYLSFLKREIDLIAAHVHPEREVVQLHWGGGTPTYLTPVQIEELGTHLHQRFTIAPDAEISLEADPRELTEAHLEAACRVGFNRLSIGVQDFDPTVQEAINRVQPERQVRDAVEWARALGFESINLDLVYGLPHQHSAQFADTIDTVLDIDPDRIALFSYAHVPEIKNHQKLLPEDALPAPSEKLAIFKVALERLTQDRAAGKNGYRFIGMDHFARPTDELARAQDARQLHRNFQGYSTRAGAEVVAFGVSGISQLERLYAQNVKAIDAYYDRVEVGQPAVYRGYSLTPDDQLRRHVIMDLMCHFELDKRAVETWAWDTLETEIDFDTHFAAAQSALAPMARDGLVTLDEAMIEVQPVGRLLIRPIAAAFDAYYQHPSSTEATDPTERPTYSQSI